jgi:hypothetical protein
MNGMQVEFDHAGEFTEQLGVESWETEQGAIFLRLNSEDSTFEVSLDLLHLVVEKVSAWESAG